MTPPLIRDPRAAGRTTRPARHPAIAAAAITTATAGLLYATTIAGPVLLGVAWLLLIVWRWG